jgi:biopolymer transport protein ExbD
MHLTRPAPAPRLISLVSMIDVLLIMLVFFMVTSTYLNLDMIPMAKRADDTAPVAEAPASTPQMIRLAPDGQATLRGRPVALADIGAQITGASVLILPSPRANTQSLVALMDALTQSGITELRLLQLADAP